MDTTYSINFSLEDFDGYEYNDTYYNSSDGDGCCDGGDVCDLKEGMHFEAVFIPVLYWVVFVVGVLGNGVLLVVLVQGRKTWSVTDTFILHLGVADVLLLITLPLSATQSAHAQGWTFGTPLCKITGAVFTVRGVHKERCTETVFIEGHCSK